MAHADISALEASGLDKLLSNASSEIWWVVVDIDASSGKPKAVVGAQGDSSLDSMKSCLREDAMQFGAFKVLGVDTKGAVTSTRLKLCFFQWVGPKTPKMHVMRVKPAKQGVQGYFSGAHLSLELYHAEDLTEADIEARLRAAGGAHQPDSFAFGRGATTTRFAAPPEPAATSTPALNVATPVATASPTAAAPAPAPAVSPRPAEAAAAASSSAAAASSGSADDKKASNNMFAAAMTRSTSSSAISAKPAQAPAAAPAGGKREPFAFTFTLPDDKRAELLRALQSSDAPVAFTVYV